MDAQQTDAQKNNIALAHLYNVRDYVASFIKFRPVVEKQNKTKQNKKNNNNNKKKKKKKKNVGINTQIWIWNTRLNLWYLKIENETWNAAWQVKLKPAQIGGCTWWYVLLHWMCQFKTIVIWTLLNPF